MRPTSKKFKYLDIAQLFLPDGSIPSFQKILTIDNALKLEGSWILRSSLQNEGGPTSLQSGKSLSVGGIDSKQKLLEAWEKVLIQTDLDEVILQKEILWDAHYTLIYEKDFFFAEVKNRQGQSRFLYWTPQVHTLKSEEDEKLKKFLRPLKEMLDAAPYWLMELGSANNKISLFQLHPVSPNLLKGIFSQDLVADIVSSRSRFAKKQGFLGLLQTEWKAKKFRQETKQEGFHPRAIFLNWEFIFHYFRLHCMSQKLIPDAHSFSQFLITGYSHSSVGALLKEHLEIANALRKNEVFTPMNPQFARSGIHFIGKGQIRGQKGKEILLTEKIDLATIYQEVSPKAILTKEVSLLGHAVLASVEKGIFLVLGLSDEMFCELSQGDKIYLDFEQKILKLE